MQSSDHSQMFFKSAPILHKHVREKISPRTRAIMTVDMKGLPVDYEAFAKLSAETGIPIVSDSAESFGALYKGKKIGTQALLHSFSFFANASVCHQIIS